MNAFNLVVTVALGSTLAIILLSKTTPLAEGMTAFLLLILLQFVTTGGSVRSDTVRRLAKSDPTLLIYKGKFIEMAMRAEQVTREEVFAVLRDNHMGDVSDAGAVALETDGSFSVMKRDELGSESALP